MQKLHLVTDQQVFSPFSFQPILVLKCQPSVKVFKVQLVTRFKLFLKRNFRKVFFLTIINILLCTCLQYQNFILFEYIYSISLIFGRQKTKILFEFSKIKKRERKNYLSFLTQNASHVFTCALASKDGFVQFFSPKRKCQPVKVGCGLNYVVLIKNT